MLVISTPETQLDWAEQGLWMTTYVWSNFMSIIETYTREALKLEY